MPILKPSQIARSIYDIDGNSLRQAGIKGIILDWENTAVKKNEPIPDSLIAWIKEMKIRHSIKPIVVSNGTPPSHGKGLFDEIPALFEAGKPKKKAFLAALDVLGTGKNETAVIGDGIFSDLWGGNRLGMYTIFVSPPWTKPRFMGTLRRLMVKVLRV